MKNKKLGKIHVYTGDGKGKTTASLGLVVRAFSSGWKCGIVYFDKGGDHYSERKTLTTLGIEFHVTGQDRIDPESGDFRFGVLAEDIEEAKRGLKLATDMVSSGKYDLVVLDEFNIAVMLEMITLEEALAVIDAKHPDTELVLTGRGLVDEIKERADLVTNMRMVKHYYAQGTPCREGIEF